MIASTLLLSHSEVRVAAGSVVFRILPYRLRAKASAEDPCGKRALRGMATYWFFSSSHLKAASTIGFRLGALTVAVSQTTSISTVK